VECRLLSSEVMTIQLDTTQAQFLDELLQTTRMQLRIERARADSHEFREMLHDRERVVESLIAQLREVRRAA
jgi:hypothetical protein